MKNKPTRHKETNTFKFKKFSDRIAEIDVDVFHRIVHRNEEVNDDDEKSLETNFSRTLQKWNVLNLTAGFTTLKKELRHVVTLPQLLNHKCEVIESLTKYLKTKDPSFMQPILELVVAVAKDLQQDFHDYFPQFLTLIIDLLETRNPDILDPTFTTLAYLFKFLWRYLVKNITSTFELLLPLLVDTKPEYVNNFAAESFAFVARKIRDKESFLQLVFDKLQATPEGTSGCGKLLFEVIAGTRGQFHSCAEQMLNHYIKIFTNGSIDEKLSFDVLHQIFKCIAEYISIKHCQVLWNVIYKILNEYATVKYNEKNIRVVKPLLCLLRQIVNHNGGKMLPDPILLISKIIEIISIYGCNDSVLKEIIDLSTSILLAENIKLSQETSYKLISTLLEIKNRKLLNYLIEKLINHTSFETLILPIAMQKSVLKNEFDSDELNLFTKIVVIRAPPCFNGDSLKSWRQINLDLRAFKANSLNYLVKILQDSCDKLDTNYITEDVIKVLIILQHINFLPAELIQIFKSFFQFSYNKLNTWDTERYLLNELEKNSLVFLLATEVIITQNFLNINIYDESNENNVLVTYFGELMKKLPHIAYIMNAIDVFVTHMSSQFDKLYVNMSTFNSINENLGGTFTSPDHRVRMSVCHLYSLFKDLNDIYLTENSVALPNAFQRIFMAEKVETSIYNYRDRLLHLRALSYESYAITNLRKNYRAIPLRFLLGNFHINFSLLWDPVAKIIATYANEDCTEFWPIFRNELEKNNCHAADDNSREIFNCGILSNWIKSMKFNDKPDCLNYKILLWKCMSEFPDYCEVRNRDLTVIFINFVTNYYFKLNSESSKSFSIVKRHESNVKDNEINNYDNADEEDGENENGEKEPENEKEYALKQKLKLKRLKKSSNFKLLLAQLTLFSKMQNPKMLYREPDMNKIYLDILTSKNVELQKLALDCLFAYKHKYLMPYKDHIYGLIDEKNLRNTLARFGIADDEGTIKMIQAEHRNELMPILMRLVYAKMITRGSGRSGGAVGAAARRKIILRFLLGVNESEMMLFIKMAFKPFERYEISFSQSDKIKDLTILTTKIIAETELSDIIPPKRLKSALKLLAIIMEEFGAKMSSNLLPRLLAIVICILAQVKGILDQSDKVLSGFLPTIKELRTNAIGIIVRFFEHFENYNWSPIELDALFDVSIFPWLDKLPIEGIHSPTTLLKLFSAWSQNPRYFCLLVKHKDNDKNMTCLPYIMKLLLGQKTHSSVINVILEMIEKLLTLQDYATEREKRMEIDDSETLGLPLQPRNILKINSQATLPEFNINYGSAILLPHIPDILLFIKCKCEKSKLTMSKTEMTILARISELHLDSAISDTLLSLSLPILVKRTMKGECEEIILELLTTIVNLMKNVNDPQIHLRLILPLFYSITSLTARKLLLQLLKTISVKMTGKNVEILHNIHIKNVELLMSLNAMDQRWIDQADFEKRLDAFSEIKAMVTTEYCKTNSNLTLEFGVAVLYNCYYFLKYESDLSLKDSAGHCLNILGPKLAKIYRVNVDDRKYLIEDTILNLIQSGIRDKHDTIRLRSISFLGAMSMQCSDIHPVLRDLNILTDKHDVEVDFFENLQHLQLHRRARALLKFCSISKTLTKSPNTKTLIQFIFPLASSYLCNELYTNKNSIIDAAIETVGTVCQLLPWYQYSIILKHYLDKLRTSREFQRQIIRIIVAILDAFHYDLSKLQNMQESIVEITNASITTSMQMERVSDIYNIEIEKVHDDNEKKLDRALAEISDDEKEGSRNEIEKEDSSILLETHDIQVTPQSIIGKLIVLSPYAAKRVEYDIVHMHLPQLHRSILSRTHHEMSHKVNKKRINCETEEDELMRVPIALAMVKLLQKLPNELLDNNLPGIFMKLCTFLKSRLDSVRRATREILQRIMITLGPNYLHHLLREMNSLLTKGFQIHVLAFTIHAVLISLKPYLKSHHISENLQSILQVCSVDLFGISADEKEIIGITKSVSEAKSTKSFDIFHILAEFISESCLLDLIEPLNNILFNARSQKTVRKVVECLRHVVLGLADNSFIQNDKMLIFLYGLISRSIPSLSFTFEWQNNVVEKNTNKNKNETPDCYIIPPEPKSRTGLKNISKNAGNTNDHIMLEFGLKLFHVLLKREKINGNMYKSYLDPFVAILVNCLESQHIKLSTLALQCLNWILKMNLESMHSNIENICSSIFKILHKYGSAGLGKGDNFDLVMAAFKTMSVLVRDVQHFEMSRDHIKALLLYAEQDLHNCERQATAFNLIRAIIGRKIVVPEIHNVMNKVSALSVTSESENVRQQCRVVFYHFLMDYPLGKRLQKHLSFYLAQLNYEMQTGRLSALEMIYCIITGFPENILIEHSGLLFVMVGARVVNDEDPTCRKLAAKCVNEIITRVPHNQRVKFFDIISMWLKDSNIMHRRLAVQLCGIFVTIEKEQFETHLVSLLPLILKQFHAINIEDEEKEYEREPGCIVERKNKQKKQMSKIKIKNPERAKDHHAFQVLQLTLKISANCTVFLKSEKYVDAAQLLAEYAQSLLGHPHLWVRLAATQQIGFILATIEEEKLVKILQKNDKSESDNYNETDIRGYIYTNPVKTLRTLSLDLLAQLQPGLEFEELADQVVKNLVFIARVIKSSTGPNNNINEYDNNDDINIHNDISILWLWRRIRKCVNVEVTQSPKSTVIRTAAFKWIAGVIVTINIDPFLKPILFLIMSPLVREMMITDGSNIPLRQLAKEVAKMIKKRMNDEEYMKLLAKVQQKFDIKRAERKKTQTQQFVIDPELAAKRKISRQQKKKEAKKRKISQSRGKKNIGGKKIKKDPDLNFVQ